jgi:hypothetical protein
MMGRADARIEFCAQASIWEIDLEGPIHHGPLRHRSSDRESASFYSRSHPWTARLASFDTAQIGIHDLEDLLIGDQPAMPQGVPPDRPM